jgi:membrane-associated protease RseP (regulator of RpoE activity)
MSISSHQDPCARLCHITKWEDFDGYGFNLHAEKGKPGQYIGKVDENSPAEAAGLKQGDRIVEVNGVNISNENHKQVVERIKVIPHETKLLVVDAEADEYYTSKSIIIKGTLPNVKHLKCPELSSTINRDSDETPAEDIEDTHSQSSSTVSAEKVSSSPVSTEKVSSSPVPEAVPSSHNGSVSPTLNLNMTAAEMRAQLASRKKYDPRKENIEITHKFKIIETL